MFLSEMAEAKQELIEIKDFDGDAIHDLVHFAYSSRLILTVDNVQPLLYAACILQVTPLVDQGHLNGGGCGPRYEIDEIFTSFLNQFDFDTQAIDSIIESLRNKFRSGMNETLSEQML